VPLPGDINTITVTGTYVDATDVASTGTVTFTPSADLTDSTGAVIIRAIPIPVSLSGTGTISVTLPCTDNVTITPAGWYWIVTETVTGRSSIIPNRTYNVFLPHTLGSTIDISRVTQVVPQASMGAYGQLAGNNTWLGGNVFSGLFTLDGTLIQTPPGGTTLFLRGDGTWVSPGGGGAVTSVNGHTGVVVLGSSDVGAVPEALATTKGDLAVATGSSTFARLGVGSDNQYLVADSTQSTGMSWKYTANPWQFDVRAYGAKGDGKAVSDGAITTGTNTLACLTTTPFTSADTGKTIIIRNAGGSGVPLVTTMTFVDSGHVTLGTNASNTVSNTIVMWATDDTMAFQNALNAANTYITTNGAGQAEVGGPPAIYGIFGPLQTGAPFHGNGQLMVGGPISTAGRKANLWLRCWGTDEVGGSGYWLQTIPQASGMVLLSNGVFASAGAQATSANNNGNASVIGGPAQPAGYGSTGAVFSNMHFGMQGVSIITPLSSSGLNYCGIDLSGVSQASLIGCVFTVTGTYDLNDFNSPAGLATGISKAYLLPANGNNDFSKVEDVVVYGGYTYGSWFTEHTNPQHCVILYCWSGVCIVAAYFSSVGAIHGYEIPQINVEGCVNELQILGQGSAGLGPFVDISQLDTEAGAPTFIDDSSGAALAAAVGQIKLVGEYTQSGITVASPTSLEILSGQQKPIFVTPPTYTLGTAFQNTTWRWVSANLFGGTSVTAVKIGQSMGGVTAPAMTSIYNQSSAVLPPITADIPPGGWLEIDGTGTKPTMTWSVKSTK